MEATKLARESQYTLRISLTLGSSLKSNMERGTSSIFITRMTPISPAAPLIRRRKFRTPPEIAERHVSKPSDPKPHEFPVLERIDGKFRGQLRTFPVRRKLPTSTAVVIDCSHWAVTKRNLWGGSNSGCW